MEIGKTKNSGICLLRIWVCFHVVLCHFWNANEAADILLPFSVMREYAVSTSMVLSFYLVHKTFVSRDKKRMGKRIWRIAWPQIGWTLIYWGVYELFSKIFNLNWSNGISDFLLQLLTGHVMNINPTMWFQVVMLAITLLFVIVFMICEPKTGLIISIVLGASAIALRYSGITTLLFSNLPYELKYPLGRFFEMIPYAVVGNALAYWNFFERIRKFKWISFTVAIFVTLLSVLLIPDEAVLSFGDHGIKGLFIACGMVAAAYVIPIERIPAKVHSFIEFVSRYTLGIYCGHRFVGKFFEIALKRFGIKTETFLICVCLYVVCFMIMFVISKLPFKLTKQLVE